MVYRNREWRPELVLSSGHSVRQHRIGDDVIRGDRDDGLPLTLDEFADYLRQQNAIDNTKGRT